MDLDQALAEFDATETTLRRLEALRDRLSSLVPEGIAFLGSSQEGVEYEDLCRAFRELVAGLPKIDGYQIEEFPLGLDEIAQSRLDSRDVGHFDAVVAVERAVAAPGEAIREYRFRFNRVRRKLVRERVEQILGEIDAHLSSLAGRVEADREPIADPPKAYRGNCRTSAQ